MRRFHVPSDPALDDDGMLPLLCTGEYRAFPLDELPPPLILPIHRGWAAAVVPDFWPDCGHETEEFRSHPHGRVRAAYEYGRFMFRWAPELGPFDFFFAGGDVPESFAWWVHHSYACGWRDELEFWLERERQGG